jgi:preprotein translocase SecE subunit
VGEAVAEAQNNKKRRPRIRKSAPTVREKVEAAAAKSEEKKPGFLKRVYSKIASPFKKLRIGDSRVYKWIAKPFSYLKRALRWLVPKYFINSWRELRQVQWPSRKETWRLTLAVFVFAIVFGALVAGVDKTLDEIFKRVVLK